MKFSKSKIERFYNKYEFTTPYLLCASDCESMKISELIALEPDGINNYLNLKLGYTETKGDPILRQALAENFYNRSAPENLLVFSGGEEAIFIAINSLLDKEDHVIVQFPAYQSQIEIARSIGCSITFWDLKESKSSWMLDFDYLKSNIRNNTKAIIITNPHNPTGYLMTNEEINLLVQIARDRGIYLFSDEVYRYSEYNTEDRLPAISDIYEKGISVGVLSKTFGLPGLRIGWISTMDQVLYKKMEIIRDYLSICNSGPSEYLARIAVSHYDIILKRILRIIKRNLVLLDTFFDDYSDYFQWIRPKAGPIALVKGSLPNIEDFTEFIRKEIGVLLIPSSIFDYGNKHFRIGFGRSNMDVALNRVRRFMRNYNDFL